MITMCVVYQPLPLYGDHLLLRDFVLYGTGFWALWHKAFNVGLLQYLHVLLV
jgi:hypothetical protein